MHTLFKLKTIKDTNIEAILNDVVTHHCKSEDMIRCPIISPDVIPYIQGAVLDDVMGVIQVCAWNNAPDKGKLHTQYIALEDVVDIEIILRYSEDKSKTAIFIQSNKDEDDYDDAVVYVFYHGSVSDLYSEMTTLNIKQNNVEKVIGDNPFTRYQMMYNISSSDLEEIQSLKAQDGTSIDIDLD